MVGEPGGERDDRQRRVEMTARWEDRAPDDVEVVDPSTRQSASRSSPEEAAHRGEPTPTVTVAQTGGSTGAVTATISTSNSSAVAPQRLHPVAAQPMLLADGDVARRWWRCTRDDQVLVTWLNPIPRLMQRHRRARARVRRRLGHDVRDCGQGDHHRIRRQPIGDGAAAGRKRHGRATISISRRSVRNTNSASSTTASTPTARSRPTSSGASPEEALGVAVQTDGRSSSPAPASSVPARSCSSRYNPTAASIRASNRVQRHQRLRRTSRRRDGPTRRQDHRRRHALLSTSAATPPTSWSPLPRRRNARSDFGLPRRTTTDFDNVTNERNTSRFSPTENSSSAAPAATPAATVSASTITPTSPATRRMASPTRASARRQDDAD